MKTKNHLSKSPKLWILLLSIVLFTYCQKEDFNDSIDHSNTSTVLQMRYVAPSEIVHNEKLSTKLKDIERSVSSTLSRTVYDSTYDIFIETDHVKFMESPDGIFHSYTFPITKDSTEQTIRNLVLFSYHNEPYESAIINYHLSESQLEELNDTDHISSTYTVDVESIDEDLSSLLSRDDLCDYIAVTYHVTPDTQETWVFDENSVCQHIDPETGETECFVHTITYLDCPDSVDGSGTTTDNGNDPDWTWSYTSGGSGTGDSNSGNQAIGSSPTAPFFTKSFSMFFNDLPIEHQNILNSSFENFNIKLTLQNFFEINGYTDENKQFVSDLIEVIIEDEIIDQNALSFALETKAQDKVENAFDFDFLLSVNQYMNLDITSQLDLTDPVYMHYVTKIAVLKNLNPEWSLTKVLWEATKDVVHIGLDVFGLIPVVGEVADLTNGVLYLIEGDGINATLSFGAALPFIGYGSTITKYGIKIVEATNLTNKVKLVWKVTSDGIDFGSRGKLRGVLGLTDSAQQAHHIMPWAQNIRNHPIIQKAAFSDNQFHMSEALNGIAVPSWRNQPNHNTYNTLVKSKLDEFNDLYPDASLEESFEFVNDLISDIREWIINNPNSHLNDLVLP